MNSVRADDLQTALKALGNAIRETESILEVMRTEHDPLASHIFVSRRQYRNIPDTKSGKRTAMAARFGWQKALELGFRGSLDEWERLMEATTKRPRD